MAPRTGTTLLVLAVLGASAAAFAVSEGLKVQRSAITDTHVTKTFSPVCRCATARATIAFRLRRAERLSIAVLDEEGREVRVLVQGRLFGRGLHHFTWNGRDEQRQVVPEGSYKPRVHLGSSGRTLVLPNPIRVDVTRPAIALVKLSPPVISPDGDGRSDVLHIFYRVSEHAHALLYVNGKQRVHSRFQRLRGKIDWYGRVNGRTLPPGEYRLGLVAVDRAGNRSRPLRAGRVRVRFVELTERVVRARPRGRIVLRVVTDATTVRYALRRGSSVVGSGTGPPRLVLEAPAVAGRYLLVVEAAGHRARATVVVRAP